MGPDTVNDLPPPPPVPPTPRSRGRPKGSKNKLRSPQATLAPDDPAKAKGRGPSFTPHEGLILARAWIAQSSKGAYQREESFWGDIEAYCSSQGVKRSRDSLKTQWRRMGRQCQSFINCKAEARGQRTPGSNGETYDDIVMNMYRARTGRTDASGQYQYATPFKFVEAAEYLHLQPKFVESYMKDASATDDPLKFAGDVTSGAVIPGVDDDDHHQPGDIQEKEGDDGAERKDDEVIHVGRTGDVAVAKTPEVMVIADRDRLKARPIGIKRKKEVEQTEAEASRVENIIASMRESIDKANDIMARTLNETKEQNDFDNDVQLLQQLQRGTPEHDEVLQGIMHKRRVRRKLDHPQDTDKDHVPKPPEATSSPPSTVEMQGVERADVDPGEVDAEAT